MKTIFFNKIEFEVVVCKYNDSGRPRLYLKSLKESNFTLNITVNPISKINNKLAIIKSYRENKGLYEILLKNNIVKHYIKKVQIGVDEAFVCELNLCQICNKNIFIPRVCLNCAKKILKENE